MNQSHATVRQRLTRSAHLHAASVHRTGAWLAARGVRAGDVVAVCAPDSVEVAVTRRAVSSIGAVAVTLSPPSPRRDLFAQLCMSGARWLVTTPNLFAQKLEVAVRPSAVVQTFLIGGAPPRLAPEGDPALWRARRPHLPPVTSWSRW